jgi:hypothetical protein
MGVALAGVALVAYLAIAGPSTSTEQPVALVAPTAVFGGALSSYREEPAELADSRAQQESRLSAPSTTDYPHEDVAPIIIGGSESLGPAWTYDATIEPPAGEKDTDDGYTIAGTPEQQAQLGPAPGPHDGTPLVEPAPAPAPYGGDESGASLPDDDEDHTTADIEDGEDDDDDDDDDGAASCPARVRRARRALNSAIDQTTHAIDELKRGVGVLWSAVEEAIRNLAAAESDLSAKAAAVKVAREAERGALLLSEAANQAWETMVDACQDETDPTAEPCRTDLLHAGSERDEADVKLSDAQGNTLDAKAEEQAALDAVRAARGSLDVATRTQQAELKRLQDAVDSAAATEASKFGRYLPIVRRCQPSAKSLAAVTAQHAELVEAVLSQHVSIGAVDTLAAVDCVSSAPVAANFTSAAAVAAGEEEEGDDAFDAEHWGGSCRRMISRASRQLHASLFAVKVALDSLQSAALKLQQGVEEAKVAVESAWVTLEGAIGEEAAKDDLAASAFAEYQEARSTWQQLKVSCGADDPACRTELLTAFDNYKHTGVLNSYAAQDLAAATAAREAAQQSFDLAKAALEATKATQLRELTRLQRSVSDEIVAEQGASCNYQYIVHRCNQFADDAVDAIDTAASADDDDDAAAGHSELAFLLTSLTTYAGMVDSLVPTPAPPPPAPAPAPTPATDSQATGGDGNHAGDDHEVNEVTTEVAPSEETTTTTTADGVAVGLLDHPAAAVAAAVAMCNPSLTDPVQMCPGGGPCPDCGEEACPCPPPPVA